MSDHPARGLIAKALATTTEPLDDGPITARLCPVWDVVCTDCGQDYCMECCDDDD